MEPQKAMPHPGTPVTEGGAPMSRSWFQWIRALMLSVRNGSVPVGCILGASLTAAQVTLYFDATGLGKEGGRFYGWAICNGSNGTPSLDGRFPRFEVTAAGGTGGSDSSAHTHAIDHDHGSFTSGSESSHTHTDGSLSAKMHINGGDNRLYAGHVLTSFTPDAYTAVTAPVADTTAQSYSIDVAGTTSAGSSHSHSVDPPALTGTSGAASATENRPAYHELVPVMRIA